MSNKLFVGGLSWDTDDHGLRNAFEQYGEVREAKVITDRDTGRSRGFGFVEMATYEDAVEIRGALSGASLGDRNLVIDLAKPSGSAPTTRSDGKIAR